MYWSCPYRYPYLFVYSYAEYTHIYRLTITNRAIKPNPKAATDLGCGTGLSMYMLDSKWPSIEKVTGIDLSTYKLAVCQEKKSMMPSSKSSKYNLIHAPAEDAPVESNSQDLVSLCLVAHESPKWVSKSIFAEAFRILKPGRYHVYICIHV
jgi:ubiquinone/menaquinone biosynthesis C-methylase UbiE